MARQRRGIWPTRGISQKNKIIRMRHGRLRHKLGRNPEKRRHLVRNLLNFLFRDDRIHTTLARGKMLIDRVDQLVALAHRSRPQDLQKLGKQLHPDIVQRLTSVIVPRIRSFKSSSLRGASKESKKSIGDGVQSFDCFFQDNANGMIQRPFGVKFMRGALGQTGGSFCREQMPKEQDAFIGPFARLWRLGERRGDRAPMAFVELMHTSMDLKETLKKYQREYQKTDLLQYPQPTAQKFLHKLR